MERTRTLIFILCAAMVVYSAKGFDLPESFPYTLQETPIKFTADPESKSVLAGTTVTLSCNATIVQSTSYKSPELLWRLNGRVIGNSTSVTTTITTQPDSSKSQLTIARVSASDSGYYECIVYDGYHLLDNGETANLTVTSSQRANLEVIEVDQVTSEDVVSAVLGDHLQLPCVSGVPHPPNNPSWKKDGRPLVPSENEVILQNGTLLITEVSLMSAGNYQCSGYYNNVLFNGTSFNVSVTEGDVMGSPVVIIDGPSGLVSVGEQLTLTCYALNSTSLQLQWTKDGQVLQDCNASCSAANVLRIPRASAQDSGSYACQVVSQSTTIARTEFNVTVASKPSVEMMCNHEPCQDDITKRKSFFDRKIVLSCTVSDPLATIYWYRNGEDFQAYSSGSVLQYSSDSPDDLLGVYQCFAAGVGYDTLRVVRAGFSNPPGNFTCKAVDQSSDVTKPRVILTWERPTFQAYHLDEDNFVLPPTSGTYIVVYEANGTMQTVSVNLENHTNNTAFIDLPIDAEYTFYIYFSHPEFNRQNSQVAIANCTEDTDSRRTKIPRRLNVDCPNTIPANSNETAMVLVDWISPEKCDSYSLSFVTFRSVCLRGNDTTTKFPFKLPFPCVDDRQYNFNMEPQGAGSVCLFGGEYEIYFRRLEFPIERCAIPTPQPTGKAQLSLTCSNSTAAVEVITPGRGATLVSTEIYGKCITPKKPLGTDERYLEPGNASISDLPDSTICSFFGTYKLQTSSTSEIVDFEPAQCIVNHPGPAIISEETPTTTTHQPMPTAQTTSQPMPTAQTTSQPMTTPHATHDGEKGDTTTTEPEMITTQESLGVTISRSAITWIAVNLSLAVIVVIAMVMACFVWKSYTRKVIKTRKERIHIWDDFITKQEGAENLDQDPLVFPQFPSTLNAPDTFSIATEVDYLYKEEGRAVFSKDSLTSLMESMKNDEKAVENPKLIMDRFLNGCHQRVWESSHESLSNVSPSQEQKTCENSKENPSSTYDDTITAHSSSHHDSDTHSPTAQHYTIPLQRDSSQDVNASSTERYIPSGGSSGYGTCSDHYFESGSSASTAGTTDYFKSRLADVAECNSLSTCDEEEGHQTVVDIMNHSSRPPTLECGMNSDPKDNVCIAAPSGMESVNCKPNRQHGVALPTKDTGKSKHDDITRTFPHHINNYGITTSTHNDLLNRQGHLSDYEHCFTDDEGYLRFTKETAV